MTVDLPYAGFWPRLKAGLVDFAVFAPLMPLSFWSLGEGPGAAAAVYVASSVLYFGYAIVGHGLWGQTLGKRLIGIRVLDTAGQPCGWTKAWRRSAVDIVLGSVSAIAYVVVLSRIPQAAFDTLGWAEIQQRYDAIRPWWAATAEYAYWTWLASEVVTVLLNRRRRALHDYVAGTVVAYVRAPQPSHRPPLPRGRRALLWGNGIVSAMAAATAALLLLAAAAVNGTPGAEDNGQIGLVVLAAIPAVLAVAFGVAARAARSGSRRLWLAQAIAVGAAVLAALPFVA